MNIALIMLIAYMAITIGISLYFAKKNSDASTFMAAKSELTVIFIIPLLFAEMIAGSGTIGNAATGYTTGFSAVWMNWGMVLGVLMFIFLALKFYKAMNKAKGVISVPEAYKYIFDEKCRLVMLFVIVIVYVILFSTQSVAAASIIAPLIGLNETLVTWIISAIFIFVTLLGGMKGIASMNLVHAAVMLAGMFFVAYKAVTYTGGFEALQENLPDSYFSFMQPNVPTTVANAVGTGISMIAAATTVSVSFAAKDLKTARIGMTIAAVIIIPFALAPALIGMCAKVIVPNIEANGALFAMANEMGGLYGGLASMAIIAAIWSTAPALMLIASTTLTKDLYKLIRPKASDKQELFFSKICIVIIGIVGTILGLSASSILDQMYGAFQIRSIVAITLVVALFWPRVSTTAAFWSMLMGGLVSAGWFFAGNPMGISCFWPGAAICLVILIALTLMSKEKVTPGYKLYKESVAAMMKTERERA